MPICRKVALFDFCDTLVCFQTADEFIHFTRTLYNTKWMKMMYLIYRVLRKIGAIKALTHISPYSSVNKRMLLFQLRGLSKEQLTFAAEKYYQKRIKPNLIYESVTFLKHLQEEGFEVYVVSGGYDIYLSHFCEEFNVNYLISTKIAYSKGRCRGTMQGKDCIFEEKVRLLDSNVDKSTISYSIAVSDSISDLPLLNWADEAYVVRHALARPWANLNGYKELLWSKRLQDL